MVAAQIAIAVSFVAITLTGLFLPLLCYKYATIQVAHPPSCALAVGDSG